MVSTLDLILEVVDCFSASSQIPGLYLELGFLTNPFKLNIHESGIHSILPKTELLLELLNKPRINSRAYTALKSIKTSRLDRCISTNVEI